MNESLLRLSSIQQYSIFSELESFLLKNGFQKVTPEELALERRAVQLSSPTQKRQSEGDECPVFRKLFMCGYFLEVIPRFNEKSETFTEHGQVTVHVKKFEGHKRVFGIYFKKWDGMRERVETVTGFLMRVLQQYPRNENARYMLLRTYAKNKWQISFVDPDFPFSISKRKELLSDQFLDLFPAKKDQILGIFEGRIKYVSTKLSDVNDLSNLVKRRKVKESSETVATH